MFPPVVPRLDLVEVAGEAIPLDQPDPVLVLLPFGSPAAQQVVVQATDFTEPVTIEVVLTPNNGPRRVFGVVIDMDVNPDTVTVDVEFPLNQTVRLTTWTRVP